MNNDLISREALKKRIEAWEYYGVFSKSYLIDIIDNAPTVDTTCPHCDSGYAQGYSDGYLRGKEERPQGEWIKNNETVFVNRFNCSKCGRLIFEPKEKNNFCPNCGADMRGTDNG